MSIFNSNLKTYLHLPYKNIEFDIVNTFICDILKGNGNNYSDFELETIIKAFCYNLCCRYYSDININVLDSSQMDKRSKFDNVCGLVVGKDIYLEKETLLEIRNINVEILRVAFHEVQHIIQKYLIETNDISFTTFYLIVEKIIIMEMDDKYYKNNYQVLFEEVDARFNAESNLYDYLAYYLPDLLPRFFDDILYNLNECIEDIEYQKRKVNNKNYNREELLDRIIKRKPYYVFAFPILSFYYYDNGDKIPLSEILLRDYQTLNDTCDKIMAEKVVKLDKLIINSRNGTRSNVQQDLVLLKLLESSNEDIIKQRDSLIIYLEKRLEDQDYGNQIINLYDSILSKINILKMNFEDGKQNIHLNTIKLYSWLEKEKKLIRKK